MWTTGQVLQISPAWYNQGMAIQIQGYNFDGDPDGLKFINKLNWDEFQTLIYCVDNKGSAHIQSDFAAHFEITKSSDGTYMVSKN